jgi:hypothetical protein
VSDAYEAQGAQAALYAEAIPGLGYAIMDTSAELGIMTEFYEEWSVKPLYDHMRRSAAGFDGSDPLRILSFADLTAPVPRRR